MTGMDLVSINKFENLNYEKFKQMALDPELSLNEKAGFPETYRCGKEPLIWQDIQNKLTNLALPNKVIFEIGPGCSHLPKFLLESALAMNSKVILCDSQEMLAQLPEGDHIEKVEGPFPQCWDHLSQYSASVDVIIVYSVLHYVFAEGDIWHFLDCCLDLLAHEGQILLGDLPNQSKRARFFNSPAGMEFHKNFIGSNDLQLEMKPGLSAEKIDDVVIMSMISYARGRGFDAYILPQSDNLPMANRREDILITKA